MQSSESAQGTDYKAQYKDMKTKYKILKLAVRESMQAKEEVEKDHEATKLKMQAQGDELIELKARNLNLEDRALLLSDSLDDS